MSGKKEAKPAPKTTAQPESLADLIIKQLDRVHIRTPRY